MTNKDLWRGVNATIGTRETNPIQRLLSKYQSLLEGVEDINQHLASVFEDSQTNVDESINDIPWNIDFTVFDVYALLSKLKANKSSFDIPNVLYKAAAPIIAEALTHLCILSCRYRCVPKVWKTCAISPIPKRSNPEVGDLRPISILPTPAKILEALVLKSVRQQLIANFGHLQFGFRPRSSALCATLAIQDCVTKILDNESTTGALMVSYDFSKAFDRLPHDIILKRLTECSLPRHFIEWIRSYLDDRHQFVRIGTQSSSSVLVKSGIPQGSIIGPYIFSLSIGAFTSNSTDCTLIKYADDATYIFPLFADFSDTMQNITFHHDRMLNWSSSIRLALNPDKCQSMVIKKRNTTNMPVIPLLKNVEKLKILGIMFNTDWSWTDHFDTVLSMCSRRLYALRMLKRSGLSKDQLIHVYNSLIRSCLEYCAPLFISMSSYDVARLCKFERRVHRVICGAQCRDQCLPSLQERRRMLSLKFLGKTVSEDHILHGFLPPKSSSGRFLLPSRRTKRRGDSFFVHACEVYNAEVFNHRL